MQPNFRIALVCRGGPENGPFSAMAGRIIAEKLEEKGLKISAIYASSGSVPTALLGSVGDWAKLCDVWANLTPEDVVGKIRKTKTSWRILRAESILESQALGELIQRTWNLEKIFLPEALSIKFPTVDMLTNEYIIFSNRMPGHKKWFLEGVLGSMGLVPFLSPQRVFDPEQAGLIEAGKSKDNSLLLVDGGFIGNMLLEEAMRDWFDVIFLVDIHGLKTTKSDFDVRKKYHWAKFLRSGFHILSCTNDLRQYQLDDRINEEIRIKQQLCALLEKLPQELAGELEVILDQMDDGRLRLRDKKETQIIIVSNEEKSALFNFASFTKHKETIRLLEAGYEAANRTLEELGL